MSRVSGLSWGWGPTHPDRLSWVAEVVADDTPAVQAVLKADTRRLRLLEEEKRLQARLDRGEDSVAEELEKVCVPGPPPPRLMMPTRREEAFRLKMLDLSAEGRTCA